MHQPDAGEEFAERFFGRGGGHPAIRREARECDASAFVTTAAWPRCPSYRGNSCASQPLERNSARGTTNLNSATIERGYDNLCISRRARYDGGVCSVKPNCLRNCNVDEDHRAVAALGHTARRPDQHGVHLKVRTRRGPPALPGQTIEDFTLNDSLGAKRSLSEWKDRKAVVVVFLGTECPLAKLYGKRLAELDKEFGPQGVQIVGINANQQDTLQEMIGYARKHGIEFPLLKDAGARVADQFGATRTPEAFVLDAQPSVQYHGRIDDQYGVGAARSAATQSELVDAIEAVLAGEPVSTPVDDGASAA